MVQNYILDEIVHRIRNTQTVPDDLVSTLGIDPQAEPVTTPNELAFLHAVHTSCTGSAFYGDVPFQIRLSVLGHETAIHCRVVFAASLHDETDPATGQPVRALAGSTSHLEVLDWRDPDNFDDDCCHVRRSRPHWVRADLNALIPDQAMRELDDLMEEAVLALERGG